MTDPQWKPLPLESVELHQDYPAMIKIGRLDGSRLYYLQDDRGNLMPGRPYLIWHESYKVHMFWPLEPYVPPIILKIEPPQDA